MDEKNGGRDTEQNELSPPYSAPLAEHTSPCTCSADYFLLLFNCKIAVTAVGNFFKTSTFHIHVRERIIGRRISA